MKVMKRLGLFALLIVMVLAVSGCSKPPDSQMQQATAALQAAEAAGAPQYASDAWNRAKQAVDQMKAELSAQDKRFALFRNYGKVTALAGDALRLAKQALADADAKKKQLGSEVTATLAELGKSLESARNQLSRLPRIKGLDAGALKAALSAAGRQLDQARTSLSAGAFDKAMAVASQAREAITKVLRAIEKATGAPPSRKR
jgi:hypothetical protein